MLKAILQMLARGAATRQSRLLSERKDLAKHKIGRWSYGGLRVVSWNKNGNLAIGNFCSFAENTTIFLGGEHNTRYITTYPIGHFLGGAPSDAHEVTKGDVIIGNDVWVGSNAVILSGVRIGDGAVIGANSVVARDVPAFSIVAGNPAKVIRSRFEAKEIEILMDVRWWDWPDEKVRMMAGTLLGDDFTALRGLRSALLHNNIESD